MTDIVIDLTDNKRFEVNIDRSGNVFCVGIRTNDSKVELPLDAHDFEVLLDEMLLAAYRKRKEDEE